MKSLMEYKDKFDHSRAWWHVHTSHTDGHLSVSNIFKVAEVCSIGFIFFIEHIRRIPTYSVDEFVKEVARWSDHFEIPAQVGFEAKLLLHGRLDAPEDVRDNYHMFLAEHISPKWELTREQFLSYLYTALDESGVAGWIHPGKGMVDRSWDWKPHELKELLHIMEKNGIVYERNRKHNLPTDTFINMANMKGLPWFEGSDYHKYGDPL